MENDGLKYLWERYEHEVDLHRTYFDLVFKLAKLYFGVIVATLSVYFLYVEEISVVKYFLMLLFLMGTGLTVFFYRGALGARVSQVGIAAFAKALEFNGHSIIAHMLEYLLWIACLVLVAVDIGLIILFFTDF